MPLVTTKEMFKKSMEEHFAIGAFNVNNMEIIQGVVAAAEENSAPVILQVSAGAKKYANPIFLKKLVEVAIEDTGIDLALHLDHGNDIKICKQCIDNGFTSIMFDGSSYTFEENVNITKQIVDYAHDRGVVVEAELGTLAGIEDNVIVDIKEATFTNPQKAKEFVERTGVDSLAIAIGTSHGAYKFKGKPELDFKRLDEISKLLPNTPLVLHGASSIIPEYVAKCNSYGGKILGARGIPEDMLKRAVKGNICKINIDTDIRMAVTAEIRKFLVENPSEFDPRLYLKQARSAVQELVSHKMKNILGCAGKA